MARDTLLGFPAHTLPYRRGKFITLSAASRGCTPYGVHPLSPVVLFGAISLAAKSRTAAGGGKPPVSAWKPLCASL